MPDYIETLSNRLWTLLEADATVVGLFPAGRRDKPPTVAGNLRRTIARAPADFPRVEIRVTGGTHSAFVGTPPGVQPVFASEAQTITSATGPDFEVFRTANVVVTLWHELTNTAGAKPHLEGVITALMNGGTKLGLPSLVTEWSRITWDSRPMRRNEFGNKPAGAGEVDTLRFTISTKQHGKLLIA